MNIKDAIVRIKVEDFYKVDQLMRIFSACPETGRKEITHWINSSPNREIRDERKAIMFSFMYGGE